MLLAIESQCLTAAERITFELTDSPNSFAIERELTEKSRGLWAFDVLLLREKSRACRFASLRIDVHVVSKERSAVLSRIRLASIEYLPTAYSCPIIWSPPRTLEITKAEAVTRIAGDSRYETLYIVANKTPTRPTAVYRYRVDSNTITSKVILFSTTSIVNLIKMF